MNQIFGEIEIEVFSRYQDTFTLQSLYDKFGKELSLITFNFTKKKKIVLNRYTYPNLDCIKALSMTCGIPILFDLVVHDDDIFMDGGFVENFPLSRAIEDRHSLSSILGIVLTSTKDEQTIKQTLDQNMIRFLLDVLFIPITVKTKETLEKYRRKCTIIELYVNLDFFNFTVDNSKLWDLFLMGYNKSKNVLGYSD